MKKNRKISRRRSVIGMHVMHFGAVMVVFVLMVILNLLASSSCGQLRKSIDAKDRIIHARQAELDRSLAHWEATKSTDNLDRALGRRGLVMNYANPNRVIKIDGAGNLLPGQRSVALAQQRLQNTAAMAMVPAMTPRRPRR